ncbi:transport integral membrane protein [Knoellia sinensis KCTC 19936]|uniref:Transport integral membrane protein n=1 Tax=Knoellia sinensis KCTC 19936 TaxID=1385520 RepID=A0A0A0IYL3_9MICO|nr:AEC family transporter [Knoellia sinensis]KGN30305.1 transport integral membrane protein [Knoellia sinensis KCTC 19936]
MQGVFTGFATIGVVIAVGALLAHLKIVDLTAQRVLSQVAFFVGSPALMIVTLSRADVRNVLSANLVATTIGVIVPVVIYVLCARFLWRRSLGDGTIGALSAAYVNAGNLGIPVASYVLGDAALVAPTLLLQLIVLQPIALALLDTDALGRSPSFVQLVSRPFQNPLTVASLIGVVLSLTGWTLPDFVGNPLELLGGVAVPAMLIAYGIALRLGPGLGAAGSVAELATTSLLKLIVQPLVAYAVARFALGVEGHALLAIVVTAALPTAQNIFVHATRYDRATVLARDTILITTMGSVPVILLIAALLG